MYCASTQARTALTYEKEYLQDGTWELEDDEEEAWESGGNGWDVSPTLLVPELPLLAYKGIMCVAFLPFPTSSSDCTPDPRTELTGRSASKTKKKKPLNPAAMAGMLRSREEALFLRSKKDGTMCRTVRVALNWSDEAAIAHTVWALPYGNSEVLLQYRYITP
ncbi:uncharacterized protein LOC135816651 isoform X2 [Sycon ciliatum]|uniref:uncharacterized protein LOC135816651 isoform X2 n=1 Tax=Sycon ciliatum TaxID=27933 RepID=UPI0031F67510